MRQIFLFAAIGGAAAIIVIYLVFSVFAVARQDYDISVDPIKDNQYLFNTARVTVINTGRLPLTNIVVNYGGHSIDKLALLSPGDKVLLSPPDNSSLNSVTVTADHGIAVTKVYRTPLKIPGMMGS